MNKTIKFDKNGMTLVEIMVALPIFLVLLGGVVGVYFTMGRLFPGGVTQVSLQSYGRSGLDRIANDIRSAVSADISGNTLSLTLDPNNTYNNSADDISVAYTVSGTDMSYDSDTSISGNETIFLQNVQQEAGISYFQQTENLIVVTFKVARTNVTLGTQSAVMTTTAKMRNVQ
ncbi:hypothetical protein MNBD_UNCLBAC01-164 [hydrothermal vent metagenome]|uniref:Prepilin-type N-terminal cleavage/methylation domain-containing protein n=1 Tax=hydrothermal vent metagenome TaxID=652676 RepID=A0A3B1DRM7_9ZZZZ